MAFVLRSLFLLQLTLASFMRNEASAQMIPDRCWCLNTLNSSVPRHQIDEFSVFPRRAKCNNTEIILTLKKVNTLTEKQQRCLNPEIKQAFFMRSCWDRNNKNESRKTVKISECFSKHGRQTE